MCASLKADVSVPCSSTLPPIHQPPAETQSLLRINSVKGASVIVEGCLSMRCCSRALSPTDSGARCLPLLPGLLLCTGTSAMLWQFEIVLSLRLDVYWSRSQPVFEMMASPISNVNDFQVSEWTYISIMHFVQCHAYKLLQYTGPHKISLNQEFSTILIPRPLHFTTIIDGPPPPTHKTKIST